LLKKTIKYKDLDGNEVEEDFYFHLSKAELVELEMSKKGGLSEMLKRIVASADAPAIIAEFKNIILMSYGQRSEDGRFFKKNQQLRDEFQGSEAYSELFMEMVTDVDAGIQFITSIVPAGLVEEAALEAAKIEAGKAELASVPETEEPKTEPVETPPAQEDETGKGDN